MCPSHLRLCCKHWHILLEPVLLQGLREEPKLLRAHFLVNIVHHTLAKGGHVEVVHLQGSTVKCISMSPVMSPCLLLQQEPTRLAEEGRHATPQLQLPLQCSMLMYVLRTVYVAPASQRGQAAGGIE